VEVLAGETGVVLGDLRAALEAHAVLPRLHGDGERRDLPARENRLELGRRGSALLGKGVGQRLPVQVDARDPVLVDLVDRVLVVARVREPAVLARGIELVEDRLAVGEDGPAIELAREDLFVALGDQILELLFVIGLGEPDELAVAREVEADDVGLRAEGGLDVALEVVALLAQLIECGGEQLVTAGKLVEERSVWLPLLGARIGLDADEERRARRRDGSAARTRRSILAATGDEERGEDEQAEGERAHVTHLSAFDPSDLRPDLAGWPHQAQHRPLR
jgi:hypothetical protein